MFNTISIVRTFHINVFTSIFQTSNIFKNILIPCLSRSFVLEMCIQIFSLSFSLFSLCIITACAKINYSFHYGPRWAWLLFHQFTYIIIQHSKLTCPIHYILKRSRIHSRIFPIGKYYVKFTCNVAIFREKPFSVSIYALL